MCLELRYIPTAMGQVTSYMQLYFPLFWFQTKGIDFELVMSAKSNISQRAFFLSLKA